MKSIKTVFSHFWSNNPSSIPEIHPMIKTVHRFLLIIIPVLISSISCAAKQYPELMRFEDSARHWYTIFDEERVIEPLEARPQYRASQYREIADNILLFQKDNGGWAKNYDMKAILNEGQIRLLLEAKKDTNTTFDNGATHGQLTYLAEVIALTGDETYKTAFFRGLEFTLEAQYENGGWPQFYPDTSGYRKYITFNDMAMVGTMSMLQKIVQHAPEYAFVSKEQRSRVERSYDKGIQCILNCQIVEKNVKTAWCQQHDEKDLSPRDARIFEKASICNLESTELVKLLINIDHPEPEIIQAVEAAVAWFKQAEIHGLRVDVIAAPEEHFIYHRSNIDRVIVEDPNAPRIWPRFNELKTHRPIFCGRDGIVRYAMSEIDRDRRTGYGWYTYAPEEVYALYLKWRQKWTPNRNLPGD